MLSDHRTMRLIKPIASTMLSAAIRGSTVQCFLCYVTVSQLLTKFTELQWVTLIKIANTALDRSAPLVLSATI